MWFAAIPGMVKWGFILALVVSVIGSIVGAVGWVGEARLNKEAVKQLGELNTRLVATVREKNETTAKFLALPDVRNRLCAVKGPQDGCCQPEPMECKP